MTLIEKLTIETKDLKKAYLQKTASYSKDEFLRLFELSKLDEYALGETLGFETIQYEGWLTKSFKLIDGVSFWNHKASIKLDKLKNEVRKAKALGMEGFINKDLKLAELNYNESIQKLALRVSSKGLDLENLKMQSSYLDPNMSTIITDGKKSVRAYTIIASGAIQKPHYRYLVK